MSEVQPESPATPRLLVPPAPRETDPLLGQGRSARRRRGRLVLAGIAAAAMLGAGMLFGAQHAAHRVTLMLGAAAAPAALDADPELIPAGPAPADAPRQIVQALAAGRAAQQPDGTTASEPAAAIVAATPVEAAVTGAEASPDSSPDAAAATAAVADSPAPAPATPAAGSAVPAGNRSYLNASASSPANSAAAAIVWPARGPITSLFGPQHPLGIDIGVPLGTIVRAMADGRIAFAGGNACCSYGYYVDIDHGDGIITRYGHLLYVPALPVGQPIHAGDPIGLSGTTGNSTGPHLHFEVRLSGFPVNPLLVLPR